MIMSVGPSRSTADSQEGVGTSSEAQKAQTRIVGAKTGMGHKRLKLRKRQESRAMTVIAPPRKPAFGRLTVMCLSPQFQSLR